jgi:hypothetical protein
VQFITWYVRFCRESRVDDESFLGIGELGPFIIITPKRKKERKKERGSRPMQVPGQDHLNL